MLGEAELDACATLMAGLAGQAIDFYTRGKVVTSRWPDPATSQIDLGFPQTR